MRDFETLALGLSEFDHQAHLRIAYIYLCEGLVQDARSKMKRGLVRFLAHNGVDPSKYHETMTSAWIMAVRHFMTTLGATSSSTDFIERSSILLDSQLMLTHYSKAVLFSQEARSIFVEPDIQQIPRHA